MRGAPVVVMKASKSDAGAPMFQHILIATDGSELAGHAVATGLSLAKATGARVTAVTVTELWSAQEMAAKAARGDIRPVDDYEARATAAARKILFSVTEIAAKLGVTCSTVHVSDRRPADGIVTTARERNCDLIVIASHGRRGVSRLVLGSQSAEVVANTELPVLICK